MAEKIIIAELDIDTGGVIKEQQQLGKEIEALKKQLKEAKGTTEQFSQENLKAEARLKTANSQYRANQRIITGLTETQKGNTKSIAESRLAVSALSAEWAKSAKAFGEQDKRTIKIQKELDKLNRGLRDSEGEWGNNKRTVGSYTEEIKRAIQETGGLTDAFPGAARGAGILNKALNVLKANPIILFITGLVLALRGLVKVMSQNEETVDRFNKKMNQAKAVLAETTAIVGGVVKAFKHLKDLDFKAFDREVTKVFDGWNLTMKEAIEAAGQISELEVQIRKENVKTTEVIARRKKEIAELVLITRDETVSFEDRAKALAKANELELANMNDMLNLQRLRVKLAEDELAATPEFQRSDEQRLRIAEERAALYALEEQSINRQRELLNRINELENKRKSSLKEVTKEIQIQEDLRRKEFEETLLQEEAAFNKLLEAEKNSAVDRNTIRQDARLLDWENEKALLEQTMLGRYQAKEMELQAIKELELREAAAVGADIFKIQEKYKNLEVMLEREKNQAKMDLAAQAFGNIAAIFGEATKIGKAAAIIQTTIETYQAAQKSYNSLASIPVVGPVLGGIAAAAAVASGIARVNKIRSVNTNVSGVPSTSISDPGTSVPSVASSGSSLGSSLSSSGARATSTRDRANQASFNKALQENRNVLVIEDFEDVAGRRVEIKSQSEL